MGASQHLLLIHCSFAKNSHVLPLIRMNGVFCQILLTHREKAFQKLFSFFCRCKVVQFLIYFTALVSIYTLVLMSLDRYLAVVYPIESMTLRTEANCKIAILATWVICALAGTPLIFSHGERYGGCGFLDNETLPYLPLEWEIRWSDDAFYVSTTKILMPRTFLP